MMSQRIARNGSFGWSGGYIRACIGALCLVCCQGILPAQALQGTQIEYQTTGLLPGTGRDEKPTRVTQLITLDATGSKLLYKETREGSPGMRRVVLRTDGPQPVIYELLGGDRYREYREDLNQLQKERNVIEENEILRAKRLNQKERAVFFKENYWLRPDGSREVKVSREPGRKILGYSCDRIIATENGRVIVDGEVARLPTVGGGPFQLYRKLGAFSDEVLQSLSSVDGILLKGKITVVHPLKANVFEVEARRVDNLPVDPKIFEVTGLTKVEEPTEVSCSTCGKATNPKAPGGKAWLEDVSHLFCDEKCQRSFVDRYKLEKSKESRNAKPPENR